jgi:hypothetical protein
MNEHCKAMNESYRMKNTSASRQDEEPVQANVNDCELKAQVLCMGIILLLLN